MCDYDAAAALDKHLARGDTHEYWSAGLAYARGAVQLRVGDDRDLELLRVRRRARHRGGARGVGTDGRHLTRASLQRASTSQPLAAPHARAHDAEADGRLHARADRWLCVLERQPPVRALLHFAGREKTAPAYCYSRISRPWCLCPARARLRLRLLRDGRKNHRPK